VSPSTARRRWDDSCRALVADHVAGAGERVEELRRGTLHIGLAVGVDVQGADFLSARGVGVDREAVLVARSRSHRHDKGDIVRVAVAERALEVGCPRTRAGIFGIAGLRFLQVCTESPGHSSRPPLAPTLAHRCRLLRSRDRPAQPSGSKRAVKCRSWAACSTILYPRSEVACSATAWHTSMT